MTIGELIGLDEIFMKESARRFFTKKNKIKLLFKDIHVYPTKIIVKCT
jgi:hypothetical protein